MTYEYTQEWDRNKINIIFRGGAGGNFIHYALSKHILKEQNVEYNYSSDRSEYHIDTSDCTIIANAHINLWFRDINHTIKYNDEIYTKQQYRKAISHYKGTKVVFVQLSVDNYAYTEHLSRAKATDLKKDEIVDNLPDLYDEQLAYNRHYKFASKIFKQSGIDVFNLDYAKLLKYDTISESRRLCNWLGYAYNEDFANEIQNYYTDNNMLLNKKYKKPPTLL